MRLPLFTATACLFAAAGAFRASASAGPALGDAERAMLAGAGILCALNAVSALQRAGRAWLRTQD